MSPTDSSGTLRTEHQLTSSEQEPGWTFDVPKSLAWESIFGKPEAVLTLPNQDVAGKTIYAYPAKNRDDNVGTIQEHQEIAKHWHNILSVCSRVYSVLDDMGKTSEAQLQDDGSEPSLSLNRDEKWRNLKESLNAPGETVLLVDTPKDLKTEALKKAQNVMSAAAS